jgi:hypothetical protein
MMWVVGLEVPVTTSMSKFWTPFHDQNVQEWKGIISFNVRCEFDGRPNAVVMVKKLL